MSASVPRAQILGTGSAVPAKELTNDDLSEFVDTNDEWITSRTGIRSRRVISGEETTSTLAVRAAKEALEHAGIDASEVDLIVCGTCTPDMAFPSVACLVQEGIGAVKAWAFDVNAACSGFLYSLETARRLLEAGAARTALVLGAESTSTLIDWQDRNTCVLFGDGAGAAVLRTGDHGGILDSMMGADGGLSKLLYVSGGGSRELSPEEAAAQSGPKAIKMVGREVFKHAVSNMVDTTKLLLKRNGLTADDISLAVPHQANIRIIQAIQQRVGMPEERIFINVHKYGNTSAASVPVALNEAVRAGRLAPGDLLVMVAFGAGFTWGATLVEWTRES